jgi:large subunit ribosomal protein L21
MAEFAIIATGGKQYRVRVGDTLKIEKLAGDTGPAVTFDSVLMIDDKVGNPLLAGASVTGEILEQTRGDKILVFKKKRRHNYRRTRGHKQNITVVKITAIKA